MVDTDKRMELNLKQFSAGIYLIDLVLGDDKLPASLPLNLKKWISESKI
jgi:hypothetical protein